MASWFTKKKERKDGFGRPHSTLKSTTVLWPLATNAAQIRLDKPFLGDQSYHGTQSDGASA